MSTDDPSQDILEDDLETPDPDPPDDLPSPDTPPDDSPADDSPPGLIDELRARGFDASKYKTDEAALDGLVDAARLAGRRTEADRQRDQLLGRLQEKFGEDGLMAILEGKAPTAPPESNGKAEKITAAQLAVWRAQDTAGKLSDADARKWSQRIIEQEQLVNSLVEGELPESVSRLLEEVVEKRIKDFQGQLSTETAREKAERLEETKLVDFYQQHGSEVFLDPELREEGGLTPLGREIKRAFFEDDDLQDIKSPARRLSAAYKLVAPKPTPVKAALKPSRAAKHEPATSGTPKQLTREQYWKKYPKATLADGARYFGELQEED